MIKNMDDLTKACADKIREALIISSGRKAIVIVADETTKEQIQKIIDRAKEEGIEISADIKVDSEEIARKRFELTFDIAAENVAENIIAATQFEEEMKKNKELLEEELKKECYLQVREPYEIQRRREQREQMMQRSRFLSKNCKKKM